MRSLRWIAFAVTMFTLLPYAPTAYAAETYQRQDAVGDIEFGFPNISDLPFKPGERWISPQITKRFRFKGYTATAVLISTQIKPDRPKDDSLLDDVEARHEDMIKAVGEAHFIKRRFETEPGDVLELVILNNRYDNNFPIGISVDEEATELQAVGISQMIVREGRLFELAVHIKKQEGEDRDAMVTRVRDICDTWRDSLKAHPAKAWDPELPDPTAGYTWWLCPQTRTALRKPDGWHTKTTVSKGVFGYFISKENIEEEDEYLTGLMVNVTPQANRRYNAPITQIVASYIKAASQTGEVIEGPWQIEGNPFIALGVLTEHKDPKKGDYVTHHLVIGNTQTHTLYITVFEAPASEWEAAWKIGEPIIKLLILSPDV